MLRAAFRVWRRYPALWLPVLVADWCRYGLEQLVSYSRLWLVELWPRQHSVLTGEGGSSEIYQGGLYAATTFLRICASLLECFLWCSAFVLIAASIRAEDGTISVCWQDGKLWLRGHLRRTVLFSAGALVVFGLMTALLGVLSITFLSAHYPGSARRHTVTLWLGIVCLAIFACCAAPLALKLLLSGGAMSSRLKSMAAMYALFAVACSQGVFAASRSVAFVPDTSLQMNLFFLLVSALAALPYVPLFIVLSLLVQSRDGAREATVITE